LRRAAGVALGLALGAVALAGCGGPPVDQVRTVGTFDRLSVGGGLKVDVVHGDRPSVTVHGRRDVIDRVDTRASGGVLRIGVHDRGIVIGADPMGDVRVRVTVPRLQDARIDGSGNLDLGTVTTRALHLTISGTGGVTASGRVHSLSAVVHGAGDANFSRLAADVADVRIQGASSMRLDVAQRLNVLIQGAGEVVYTGDPTVTKTIQGAGEVRRAPTG
jgi:hypothetical protein